MINGIQNISVPVISQIVPQGTKMSLPVNPASLVYSHFEHVSGIPASKGDEGISISKLNLLDVLINKVNEIKTTNYLPNTASAISENSFEGIVENFNNQIRLAKDYSASLPYTEPQDIPQGVLFNMFT